MAEITDAGTSQENEQPRLGGSLLLLAILVALPFVTKIFVMALGLTGWAWQSSYKVFQLAAPVRWRWKYNGKRKLACFWPVDEPLPSVSTLLIALVVALTLAGTAIIAVLILAPILKIDPEAIRAGLSERFMLTPVKAAVAVAYLFTINAALEELHFRVWLDRELTVRFGDRTGILISAAVFAAMHMFIFSGFPDVTIWVLALVFLSLMIAGVSWSLLARRKGGIHAAWLSHGITDAGLLTWGLFWLGFF